MEPCGMLDCFYNYDGWCASVSDLYNPDLGNDCLDYIHEEECYDFY